MKYFTLHEFTKSSTAQKLGIANVPTQPHIELIKHLVEYLLDPIREAWGHAICITSGYRCEKLNKAVGGSSTSHHKSGMAADITAGTPEQNEQLFKLIIDLCKQKDLHFTQLIDETKVKGHPYQWIHISLDPYNLKDEVMHGGYKGSDGKSVFERTTLDKL